MNSSTLYSGMNYKNTFQCSQNQLCLGLLPYCHKLSTEHISQMQCHGKNNCLKLQGMEITCTMEDEGH